MSVLTDYSLIIIKNNNNIYVREMEMLPPYLIKSLL